MPKTIAYIRSSTHKQEVEHQKSEILEYAVKHNLKVDDFIDIKISSKQTTKERRIDELVERVKPHDTLVTTELSRLGRSTSEVIALINQLIEKKVRVIITKQNLDIRAGHDMTSKIIVTFFSLFAELERDLISLRTKEALAAKKAKGKRLGKPKGTIQKACTIKT